MARTAPVPNIPPIPGMNPCTWLAGGGAGAGGSGGKGGKGGNGDANAEGEDGKKDPQNGDKSAEGCGNGANGGCTNCGTKISKGDPVDVVSGEVFTIPRSDLFLPGPFNLELLRSYSSANRDRDIGLGWGWTHSLAWELEVHRRHVIVRSGDGARFEFPRLDEVGMQAFGGGWALLRTDFGYVLRPGNEFFHSFALVEPGSDIYRLVRVNYRNRNPIKLTYDRGRLARVEDSAGRTVVFQQGSGGRIGAISVPQPGGASITFARFEHDSRGDLIASMDADGGRYNYRYDDEHRLIQLIYPSGLLFTFRYDTSGRCIETWGEYPGQRDSALAVDVTGTLADGSPAKGIYHCRFEYSEDGYSEAIDSVRLQRFFADQSGLIEKAVSARGGVTTREFDDRGRVIALQDPSEAVWRWEYDGNDAVTRETDPEGNVLSLDRDASGREVRIVDANGGITTIERDLDGDPVLVTDQRQGIRVLARGAQGLVTHVDDARGGRTHYEYDSHGNCVAVTFPSGSRFSWQYDYWGRLLRETDPMGAEASYAYSDLGRLIRVTDREGRSKHLSYDVMGNVVRETLPDGTSQVNHYGGLNWLFQVDLPDGSAQGAVYNREGWLLKFTNELGEEHRLEYDSDGKVVRREAFNGALARFDHDAFGRVKVFDEGNGNYEITRDKKGAVLEVTAADGSVRTYGYNPRGELTMARSGNVELRFERDGAGDLIREEQIVGEHSYVVETTRSQAGDRLAMKTSLGHEVSVRRDVTGRVNELRADGSLIEAFQRNALGMAVERRLAEGGAIVDRYDAANRLRSRNVFEAGQVSSDEPTWVGRLAGPRERLYDYTAVDEIASVVNGTVGVTEFEYDTRRHLKSAKRTGRDTEEFTIDAVENYRESGQYAPVREYAKGGQLVRHGDTTFTYDAQGYLIGKQTPGGTWRHHWNAWSLLAAVDTPDGTRVEFDYDAFARRVAKRVLRDGQLLAHQHFVWDRITMVHEVDAANESGAVATRTYLFEDHDRDEPIAHRDVSSASWVHYVGDLNDTPEELVDARGRVVGRLERSAFGRTRPVPGSKATTPIRFPGQYEDEETGLHYNRYRYYDPETGAYASPDPMGVLGGFATYAYGPNPVAWYDPMGWTHRMTVQSNNSGFNNFLREEGHGEAGKKGFGYASGMENCPKDLQSRARCHTEQKLAHDMLEYNKRRPGALKGTTIKATGQYPPCPNCHRALAMAAKETGAKVEYEWDSPNGRQKMTYDGTPGPGGAKQVAIQGTGTDAKSLNKAYAMTEDSSKRNGFAFDNWGGSGGAAETYRTQKGDQPELDD
jgi:RHS repeat-associated protein